MRCSRIDYIGVTFRTRTLDEVREISRRMRADLWDAVKAGKLTLPIDRRFPLDRGAAGAGAHARQPAFRQNRADDVARPHPNPPPQAGEGEGRGPKISASPTR